MKSDVSVNSNQDFCHGEWQFRVVLPADLELEPNNLADQFVLTYLADEILPRYAGGSIRV